MKRILLTLALVAATIACSKQAEQQYDAIPEGIEDNLYRFGVNTSPYEYFNTPETPVPAGYKAFYVSHYGRHGSRSNWGKNYSKTLEKLDKIKEAGALTEEGLRVLAQAKLIDSLHNDMDGRLTPRGAREHRAIAGRMYEKYKDVFQSGNRRVRAVSSYVPRCIVSMAAFTGELLSRDSRIDMSWDTGEQFMKYCSSDDPNSMRYEAYKYIKEYAEGYKPDSLDFARHMFTDTDAACKAANATILDMMAGVVEFAAIAGSFDQDQTIINVFTLEDLKQFERGVSLELYLRQCNSVEFGDTRMAAPGVQELVDDFIAKADAAIADGSCVADLRFGHDWQLLAFCSRIGVKGIAERLTKDEAVNWPGWQYTPFAGNFQMIFYKNNSGEVMVKCFINERETTLLGLPDGPYYKWDDVKAQWSATVTAAEKI